MINGYVKCSFNAADPTVVLDMLIDLLFNLSTRYSRSLPSANGAVISHVSQLCYCSQYNEN
jgi:hypothetical protein